MSPAVRRAVGILCVGFVMATVCVFLGRWQWNRHVWRAAAIEVVQTNFAADPVPLDTVLGSTDDALGEADEWRTVRVVGHYDTDATVLLRNRPVGGNASYHVLVPFVVEDASAGTASRPSAPGGVLVVDRGWVPTGADASVDVEVPAPPPGTVELTARLRLDEPPTTRSAPPGQVQAIASQQVLDAGGLSGATPYAAFAQRVAEDPPPAELPGTLPPPSTDLGSNLSYAFQWWAFALLILGASVVVARRESALVAAETAQATADAAGAGPEAPDDTPGDAGTRDAGAPTPHPTGGRPASDRPRRPAPRDAPRRRGGRAEDEEDALIDAQLAPEEQPRDRGVTRAR